MRAARAPTAGGSGGGEGVVAELTQDVVTAFEEFARQRQTCAVAAKPFGDLIVVGTVRAAWPARGLRGFVKRPAQRGRALPGEMSGRAAPIGLMDGDVQAGVADRLA